MYNRHLVNVLYMGIFHCSVYSGSDNLLYYSQLCHYTAKQHLAGLAVQALKAVFLICF